MKCPFCVEEGKKSIVHNKSLETTCLGFSSYYDEEGNYHSHNPNKHNDTYYCSNGHKWVESYKSTCPNCDYGKDTLTIKKL